MTTPPPICELPPDYFSRALRRPQTVEDLGRQMAQDAFDRSLREKDRADG